MIDGMIRARIFSCGSFDLLRHGEGLIDPYLAGLKSVFSANVTSRATKTSWSDEDNVQVREFEHSRIRFPPGATC